MRTGSWQWFIFISLFFILTCIFKKKGRKVILFAANVVFLAEFHADLIVLLFLLGYSYWIAKRIKQISNQWLFFAVFLPYLFGFSLFKFGGWLQPIGYSFYSFKMMSYLMDCYHQKIKPVSFWDYLLYITFFPIFTAGPINRAGLFVELLNKPFKFDYRKAKNGAVLAALGLFEKFVFADYLGIIVARLLNTPDLGGPYLLCGFVLYSFQIYLNFDSYSNIAIGVAQLFGFEVESNFKTPYLSSNIDEFWRRWHISLSSWFRDYLYIPLGGNRKGNLRKHFNVLLVFLVSGIWHGSGINFILWGLGHGLLQIVYSLFSPIRVKKGMIQRLLKMGKIVLNFCFVTFLWIFFRASTLGEAIHLIQRSLIWQPLDLNIIELTRREWIWTWIIVGIVIVTDLLRYRCEAVKWLANRPWLLRWSLYFLLIVIFLVFGVYGEGFDPGDFIYVQF